MNAKLKVEVDRNQGKEFAWNNICICRNALRNAIRGDKSYGLQIQAEVKFVEPVTGFISSLAYVSDNVPEN